MKVKLLTFPGCPNAEPTRQVLREAMQRLSLPPTIEEIDLTAPSTLETLRGWSSPTILVDGVDLEGQAMTGEGSACRLYGGRRGAPPVDEIERRLGARLSTEATPASQRAQRVALGGAIVPPSRRRRAVWGPRSWRSSGSRASGSRRRSSRTAPSCSSPPAHSWPSAST